MRRARILIAEDHTIVMEGLTGLLKGDFDVVGAVSDGRMLVEAAKRLRPDLTPAVTRDVIIGMSAGPPTAPPALTPRQREVLRLIVEGRRMKEIGALLDLSTRTVETHKYEMMQTLGVKTTAELIRYAIEHHLADG